MTRLPTELRRLLWIVPVIYLYFVGGYINNPMTNSIADLTVALVDDRSLRIDPYVSNSSDIAKVGDHYYSGMPPGLSFLLVPAYLTLKAPLALVPQSQIQALDQRLEKGLATKHASVKRAEKRSVIAILLAWGVVCLSIPLALWSGVRFYEIAPAFANKAPATLILSCVAYLLLGTMVADFSATLYHTTISALLLWIAFTYAFQNWGKNRSSFELLISGIACGLAPTLDYPAIVYSLIIAGFIVLSLPAKSRLVSLAWVIAGYAMPVSGMLLYHDLAFGSPLANAYRFRDPTAGQQTPIINATLAEQGWRVFLPDLRKLYRSFIDPWCSVLIYNPVMVLGWLAAVVSFFKERKSARLKAAWAATALLLFANFWFYTSLPLVVPPYVGSFGARYTVYSVAFGLLAVFPWVAGFRLRPKAQKIVAGILVFLSILPAWAYLFYGSPPRTVGEYFSMIAHYGPTNYTLMKAMEAGILQSPLWAWSGFTLLGFLCFFIWKSRARQIS